MAGMPHGAKVTAYIGSLQFDRRNALRIRYRVLPGQTAWRETANLDLALGPLGSGDHTLQVEGRLFTGPWSVSADRKFTVVSPVWLSWPFLAACFALVPGAAGGVYLLRRKRREETRQLLPDLAPWRIEALHPDAQPGSRFEDRFEVGKLLARGGFANVMDGFDIEKRQRCAIKVFRGEVTGDKDRAWIEHRFAQEIAALERVRHPNVVSIYAHGTTPSGLPYLVMEFIEGRNLRDLLDGGRSPRRVAGFLRQIAAALDAIHGQSICHRDVKLENIIVRAAGREGESIVLIDFSIAIVKNANETLHGVSRAAGTFDYMAPERAMGYADPSSDIFSLAKVVIEMLSGRKLVDLLEEPAIDRPRRIPLLLASIAVNLSSESVTMIATALSFDPAGRPRSAVAFAEPLLHDLEMG
jgi:Protein kinase domain